jgi:hypothetical protein
MQAYINALFEAEKRRMDNFDNFSPTAVAEAPARTFERRIKCEKPYHEQQSIVVTHTEPILSPRRLSANDKFKVDILSRFEALPSSVERLPLHSDGKHPQVSENGVSFDYSERIAEDIEHSSVDCTGLALSPIQHHEDEQSKSVVYAETNSHSSTLQSLEPLETVSNTQEPSPSHQNLEYSRRSGPTSATHMTRTRSSRYVNRELPTISSKSTQLRIVNHRVLSCETKRPPSKNMAKEQRKLVEEIQWLVTDFDYQSMKLKAKQRKMRRCLQPLCK